MWKDKREHPIEISCIASISVFLFLVLRVLCSACNIVYRNPYRSISLPFAVNRTPPLSICTCRGTYSRPLNFNSKVRPKLIRRMSAHTAVEHWTLTLIFYFVFGHWIYRSLNSQFAIGQCQPFVGLFRSLLQRQQVSPIARGWAGIYLTQDRYFRCRVRYLYFQTDHPRKNPYVRNKFRSNGGKIILMWYIDSERTIRMRLVPRPQPLPKIIKDKSKTTTPASSSAPDKRVILSGVNYR